MAGGEGVEEEEVGEAGPEEDGMTGGEVGTTGEEVAEAAGEVGGEDRTSGERQVRFRTQLLVSFLYVGNPPSPVPPRFSQVEA